MLALGTSCSYSRVILVRIVAQLPMKTKLINSVPIGSRVPTLAAVLKTLRANGPWKPGVSNFARLVVVLAILQSTCSMLKLLNNSSISGMSSDSCIVHELRDSAVIMLDALVATPCR